MTSRVALDHNFPEPILRAVQPSFPRDLDFRWVRELDPAFPDLDDHDLIYAVSRAGYPVLVTGNHKMLNDPRVLVAVIQTRGTVLAVEGGGDDPVLMTGVLLRDLLPVLRKVSPRGQVFRVRSTAPRPHRARDLLDRLADSRGTTADALITEHGRPWQDRQP